MHLQVHQKKKQEPPNVQLRRECEVQHLLVSNTLKGRTVNEVPMGPLTSSKSCLASASVMGHQAEQQQSPQGPTDICTREGRPAEPANHKLPVRPKRYVNCEMQTGTPWQHIPASTYLRARSCAACFCHMFSVGLLGSCLWGTDVMSFLRC